MIFRMLSRVHRDDKWSNSDFLHLHKHVINAMVLVAVENSKNRHVQITGEDIYLPVQ